MRDGAKEGGGMDEGRGEGGWGHGMRDGAKEGGGHG